MIKFSEKLLRAVAELEIRSRRNIASLLSGEYRSSFRGSGMQFKEFRHYEAGDDIRHMSWTVTARTGKATVKLYEEERELDVVLLVDVSGSSLFGSRGKRKIDMYAEIAATIGLAAVKSGDSLGMLLFHREPVLFLPPRRTRDHVRVALTHLLAQPLRGSGSDLRSTLMYALKILKNRSLVILVSDFLVPTFHEELRALGKKHELILLHCYDDAERGSGIQGVHEVCDPETGEFLVLDANSKHTREALANYQRQLSSELETVGRQAKADYLPLSVTEDYLTRLVEFFKRRGPARI
jgi:uncharacterized protein (DUF58 family)